MARFKAIKARPKAARRAALMPGGDGPQNVAGASRRPPGIRPAERAAPTAREDNTPHRNDAAPMADRYEARVSAVFTDGTTAHTRGRAPLLGTAGRQAARLLKASDAGRAISILRRETLDPAGRRTGPPVVEATEGDCEVRTPPGGPPARTCR